MDSPLDVVIHSEDKNWDDTRAKEFAEWLLKARRGLSVSYLRMRELEHIGPLSARRTLSASYLRMRERMFCPVFLLLCGRGVFSRIGCRALIAWIGVGGRPLEFSSFCERSFFLVEVAFSVTPAMDAAGLGCLLRAGRGGGLRHGSSEGALPLLSVDVSCDVDLPRCVNETSRILISQLANIVPCALRMDLIGLVIPPSPASYEDVADVKYQITTRDDSRCGSGGDLLLVRFSTHLFSDISGSLHYILRWMILHRVVEVVIVLMRGIRGDLLWVNWYLFSKNSVSLQGVRRSMICNLLQKRVEAVPISDGLCGSNSYQKESVSDIASEYNGSPLSSVSGVDWLSKVSDAARYYTVVAARTLATIPGLVCVSEESRRDVEILAMHLALGSVTKSCIGHVVTMSGYGFCVVSIGHVVTMSGHGFCHSNSSANQKKSVSDIASEYNGSPWSSVSGVVWLRLVCVSEESGQHVKILVLHGSLGRFTEGYEKGVLGIEFVLRGALGRFTESCEKDMCMRYMELGDPESVVSNDLDVYDGGGYPSQSNWRLSEDPARSVVISLWQFEGSTRRHGLGALHPTELKVYLESHDSGSMPEERLVLVHVSARSNISLAIEFRPAELLLPQSIPMSRVKASRVVDANAVSRAEDVMEMCKNISLAIEFRPAELLLPQSMPMPWVEASRVVDANTVERVEDVIEVCKKRTTGQDYPDWKLRKCGMCFGVPSWVDSDGAEPPTLLMNEARPSLNCWSGGSDFGIEDLYTFLDCEFRMCFGVPSWVDSDGAEPPTLLMNEACPSLNCWFGGSDFGIGDLYPCHGCDSCEHVGFSVTVDEIERRVEEKESLWFENRGFPLVDQIVVGSLWMIRSCHIALSVMQFWINCDIGGSGGRLILGACWLPSWVIQLLSMVRVILGDVC